RVLDDAAAWLGARDKAPEKRAAKQRVEAFVKVLGDGATLSKSELNAVIAAAWLCESAMSTRAFQAYPGAHLLLALQRAASATRGGKAVRELIESVLQVNEVDTTP